MSSGILKLVVLALGLSLATSCKDKEKETAPAASQMETQTKAKVKPDSLKVNPAHGLPGHRCDLPVGAPLNGTAPTTTVNTPQSTTVSPIRIDQTPDINPPHGEPYHDCSIPVGAKLKK